MQEILIAELRTDGTQARVGIDKEYVAELAEVVKGGTRLPPIEVYQDKAKVKWIADGHHRLQALEAAGKKTIRCNLHKGEQADAAWAACAANQAHGLKRSNADKRHAIEVALAVRPDRSDRAIAEHIGVSHTLVAELRQRKQLAILPVARVGKDGVKRRLPIPKCQQTQTVAQDCEVSEKATIPSNAMLAIPSKARHPVEDAPAGVVDPTGRRLPDYLEPLYARRAEILVLGEQLAEVLRAVEAGEDDPLYAEVPRQQVIADLKKARHSLQSSAPWCLCPYCEGLTRETCRACGGRGLIGKFRYETTVPSELKKGHKKI